MEGISFLVSISNRNWEEDIGGWHCPALKIPTSEVEAIFALGKKVDDRSYQVDKRNAVILWSDLSSIPETATVSIFVKEDLTTKSETIKAEQLALENQGKAERNQRLAILLGFLSPIIVALIPLIFPIVLNFYPKQDNSKEKTVAIKELGIKAYFIDDNDTIYCSPKVIKSIFKYRRLINEDEGKSFEMKIYLEDLQIKNREGFEFSFNPTFADSLQPGTSIPGWIPKPNGIYQMGKLEAGVLIFKIPHL